MTHRLRNHKLYNTYYNILSRCYNQNNKCYNEYGERNISVCDEWKNNFLNFYNWCLANGYQEHLKIDRIDNNKGYSPDNCRWVTQTIQSRNTRILRKTNTSGYRGVSFHKRQNKYNSRITVNWITISLGSYNTAIEAAKAYDNYISEHNLEHTKNFN